MDTERRPITPQCTSPGMKLGTPHPEIVVFWRLLDGTRCSVVRGEAGKWRLVVLHDGKELFAEDYANPHELLYRAAQLRPVFARSVA